VTGYPLAGLKVLDLTQYVAGPYCTQVLADLGADVLKVERPGIGDVYRSQGPVFKEGESASFLTLNRGKTSIQLDLGDPVNRARLETLLGDADVVVENMRPGALARFDLDFASVHARHPGLVYASISAFGQEGPLAGDGGYDTTIQALSGLMAMTGHPGGPPAKIPVAALDFGSALYAVIGIQAALAARERTGRGQWVKTSLLECALAWESMHILTYLLGGEEPGPAGTRSPFFAPYEAYRTADGYLVVVGTGGKDSWGALCRAVGREQLIDDGRFATNADRVRHAEELRRELESAFSQRPSETWAAELTAVGVACAPVQRLPEALESEQVKVLRMVGSLEHVRAHTVPTVRLPVELSESTTTASAASPLLGDGDARAGFGP
jgi:crotonobetainyl-CoA:carnitine CoA-transferase CaiB-like acyl-CoA transferase